MFWRGFGVGLFVVVLGALVFAGALLTTPFSPPLTPILAISVVLLLVAYVIERLYGDPGDPVKWLPAGSWTVLTGETDSLFHHIILKKGEFVGMYVRIPVSQLPLVEVQKVGGFGGWPSERKTLKVTREGDLARVDIFKGTPPLPGPPPLAP